MPDCYIIAAMKLYGEFSPKPEDFIICADRGRRRLLPLGIRPSVTVGDFDSSPEPVGEVTIRHPVRKNDTDTMLSLRIGLEKGYTHFYLYGGTGGSPDHTIANLQSLSFLCSRNARGILRDKNGDFLCLSAGDRLTLPAGQPGARLSLFATGGEASVTLCGLSFSGDDITLSPAYPLGVSNAYTEEAAAITVKRGRVLLYSERRLCFSCLDAKKIEKTT